MHNLPHGEDAKGSHWGRLCGHFSSVQSLSHVRFFATPWTAVSQASLSITNSQSLLKLMSIESVMPSNHLILCHPLLLLPLIFPSIRVFSDELVLHITWPKDWSFSFSISPSTEYSGLISFGSDWFVWTVGSKSWSIWNGAGRYGHCPLNAPHHVLCLPFVCGKLYSKNKFNQRSRKCRNKGKQSKETK